MPASASSLVPNHDIDLSHGSVEQAASLFYLLSSTARLAVNGLIGDVDGVESIM
jgi:hypothetical protein